jgi:protoporphyrinogen oxidase
MPRMHTRVAILGAGPAGLTASYLLSRRGVPVVVLEADPERVGGLSRTVRHRGYHFDIGGHRFFSKSRAVEDLWSELLPDDMLNRPRSSRIYYRGKFFSYPLRPLEALRNLGPAEAVRCVASFARARLTPHPAPTSFEDWVVNQFGRRLYEIFFKTYTEKVWGMPCTEISADWAAQRIKGLSLWSAVVHGLLPRRRPGGDVIKTLIDSFRYPRLGPGMMWDAAARKTVEAGGHVLLGHTVAGVSLGTDGRYRVTGRRADGAPFEVSAEHVISSAPLRDVVRGLEPALPDEARAAAEGLRYRDFITVALVVRERDRFSDNWIYIHDPGVRVGRVQNFKSWSPEMVPDPATNCYGLEYFCFEGDGLWSREDASLVDLAREELARLGLAGPGDVLEGVVLRQPKAYPVYDGDYARRVAVVREALARAHPRLHLVGRNGMHKYNNQDHAMMTAMLTVENILAGREVYDVWAVNQDAEYHESGRAGSDELPGGVRAVPARRA